MKFPKFLPVKNTSDLRDRIARYFRGTRAGSSVLKTYEESNRSSGSKFPFSQELFDFLGEYEAELAHMHPNNDVVEALNFISSAISDGRLYLFGGIIRDMALFGKRGFNSDIDLVADGEWEVIIPFIESLGATKNKFGGYRFNINSYDIDIWKAEQTWAIKQGHVQYKGISSLLDTTVLNWDAIVMNWDTKQFIHKKEYFHDLRNRHLEIVLESNPNPLGMFVRVLRHLIQKNAESMSFESVVCLNRLANQFSFEDLNCSEIRSYGGAVISENIYSDFRDRIFQLSSIDDGKISLGDKQLQIFSQSSSVG